MGLDYLHRICKIIHTDLKPENVVFEIESSAKLELLETGVLNTKLVELYDHDEPIFLNKKQAKAHKKNQRKKEKKKAAAAATTADNSEPVKDEVDAEGDDQDEEVKQE